MTKQERRERQNARWEEWRQADFDRLLTLYTRVINEYAVAHFTNRDIDEVNELAEDSSFLLDQLQERHYRRDTLRPFTNH